MSLKTTLSTALENLKFVQTNFDKLDHAQRRLRINEIGLLVKEAVESLSEAGEDTTVEVHEMVAVQMAVNLYRKLANRVQALSSGEGSASEVQKMLNIQI